MRNRSNCRGIRAWAGVIGVAVLAAAGCTVAPGPSGPDEPFPIPTWLRPTPTPDVPAGPARAALDRLPVKGRAPMTGYARTEFGPAWTDDVDVAGGHDGCGTRDDVLRRDLREVVVKPRTRGCVVTAGVLLDPYSGERIAFRRGPRSARVQIDHVVPLADAWRTGAQGWPASTRKAFANDPLNLLAVAGAVNQSKRAGDAATWLPPARAARCPYVARQIAVKTRYRLWVTPAEHDAMARVLTGCPRQALPRGGDVTPPPPRDRTGLTGASRR